MYAQATFHVMKKNRFIFQRNQGFTLILTISLLVLLVMISIGLLSLSSVTLRGTAQTNGQSIARSNARLALMIAIGELQKQMGPDMRISAEAAIFDGNPKTSAIEGVAQPHWLAAYNSWGNWLNTSYTPPGGSNLPSIRSTYIPKRSNMFRSWLLSMPTASMTNANAADSLNGWDDSNSVIMVGKGSLGASANANPENITRAYLKPVNQNGKHAWWISPENHKAKISLAKKTRNLSVDAWQASQGNTAEVGVGSINGFAAIDSDPAVADKLVTTQSLAPAEIDTTTVANHFFDLTAQSQGVVASVRSGHLKKDLSLLFERPGGSMPAPFNFSMGSDIREPSIRPMSADLVAKRPVIPNRHFASWTNMRHYYRMYRTGSDASQTEQGKIGALNWRGSKPFTDFASSSSMSVTNPPWDGSNHYWRAPVLAKLTLIYSLATRPAANGKFSCLQYYSPVFTFWNPYNTELVIPSGMMTMSCKGYRMWPTNSKFYTNGVYKTMNGYFDAKNFNGRLTSGGSGDIVFQPGELKVFSMKATIDSSTSSQAITADLAPGFDPNVVVGDERIWRVGSGASQVSTFSPAEKPAVSYEFSCAQWGGGVNNGNTPGAMFMESRLTPASGGLPMTYSNDWFQRSPHVPDQTNTAITPPGIGNLAEWTFDGNPKIVAYAQMAIKGIFQFDYPSIDWEKDWRSRNWIHSPPYYFGSGMYMSMDDTIAHTQRLDCPYIVTFGATTSLGVSKIVGQIGDKAFLGSGAPAYEQVTSAALLELPTAPVSSLAGFANMRINPGWLRADQLAPNFPQSFTGNGSSVAQCSLYCAESKRVAYQSGVTGPGIGNSFMHPMLRRDDVYRFIDNSKSQDVIDRQNPSITEQVDTKAYCDYWDHVFLLNDALWDDFFVSSLANQTRPGASSAVSLSANLDRLIAEQGLANSRYRFHDGGRQPTAIKTDLQASTGYLKAAKHLVVDGMFNVNSTSVEAWQALFAGIRERQLVYRTANGSLQKIAVPSGKRIALSRFDTEVSDKEMDDAGRGVTMPDGTNGWSGVRFLDDNQLRTLAEECVKQVKARGPFLNFSEFINRRLATNELGLMGALQSAIDYDDQNPDSRSINFRYKNPKNLLMITQADLGTNSFATPEAATGSRLAGVPGYIIQSDLLKPIANTLNVRDDTFRIRAYGEAPDANGGVSARAWCEAVVQRVPEYIDPANDSDVSATTMNGSGAFAINNALRPLNRAFGRRFQIESFRWLNQNEI